MVTCAHTVGKKNYKNIRENKISVKILPTKYFPEKSISDRRPIFYSVYSDKIGEIAIEYGGKQKVK